MEREDVVIEGRILLDDEVDLDGAVAEVRLFQAPLADAPSRTVGSARQECSGRGIREIPFRLAAAVDPRKPYRLAAEVRRRGGERLDPGDLRSVQSYGWRRGDGPAELSVKRID